MEGMYPTGDELPLSEVPASMYARHVHGLIEDEMQRTGYRLDQYNRQDLAYDILQSHVDENGITQEQAGEVWLDYLARYHTSR